ncbi:MAG: hypothetical protein O2876_08495 [Proteobacteria bacterium]|nr:hypothetical protein [Pseudomonadota bacterium]
MVIKAGVRWLVGLVLLLALDLFAEAVVFEWLQWNGTTKNDWFFMLWWALVVLWTLVNAYRVIKAFRAG